jgi:hypothetical protein
MVEMPVRDQHLVQPFEAQARFEDLALGAFAAIYQKTVLVVQHHLRGQPAMDRRRRGGGSEKYDFEHRWVPFRPILPQLEAWLLKGPDRS